MLRDVTKVLFSKETNMCDDFVQLIAKSLISNCFVHNQ